MIEIAVVVIAALALYLWAGYARGNAYCRDVSQRVHSRLRMSFSDDLIETYVISVAYAATLKSSFGKLTREEAVDLLCEMFLGSQPQIREGTTRRLSVKEAEQKKTAQRLKWEAECDRAAARRAAERKPPAHDTRRLQSKAGELRQYTGPCDILQTGRDEMRNYLEEQGRLLQRAGIK